MNATKIILSFSFITIGSNYIFTSILHRTQNQSFSSLYNEINDLKRQLKNNNLKK